MMKPALEDRLWRRFDAVIFLTSLVLVGLGLAVLYSASLTTTTPDTPFLEHPVARQAIIALLGYAVFLIATIIDYRIYGNVTLILYGIILLALVAVLIIGVSTYGAQRRIDLSILPLQPSEMVKVLMILVLSKFLADRRPQMRRLTVALASLGLVALPAALIYLQPDVGTMLVVLSIWLGMAIAGGIRPIHLLGMAASAVAALPIIYFFIMRPYMRERLWSFLNPTQDPLGAGYNILQAQISVGSGGFWGKGFANGTQSQLHFLRIQKTDFIFSVLGEELGFVGALILISLFVLLLLRAVKIASEARDLYGRLIVIGVAMMIFSQAFLNIAGNIGVLPITGIPLPFLSLGGNSLLTFLLGLGMVESVAVRHKKIEFSE